MLLPTLLLLSSSLAAVQEDVAAPPPNVLILYADDMGWGDLGVQNPESKIPTPNLDRLAAEGLRCTDAHSSSGICTPSRFALLTGTYHWRRLHGIVKPFGPSVFRDDDLTLAEMMRARGYDTACIGKWHLGWDWSAIQEPGAKPQAKRGFDAAHFRWNEPIPDGPLAHGFDEYFGDDVPNYPPYGWIEGDRMKEAPTVPLRVDPEPTEGSPESRPGPMVEGWRQDMVMPRLTARAVEWLCEDARQTKPFFLYFAWTSPHAPITPAGEYRGTTDAGGYGDFLHQSDAHLGAVLSALEEQGLTENTIVVFTSDNGPEAYAYERTRASQHRSAGPLRGVKRDVFEGGHRVPFLVRWPGVVAPGTVSSALVSQIDLMRTLAAAIGAELPEGAASDSLDQSAVWRGDSPSVRDTCVHNTYPDVWALRSGQWLYLDAPDGAHNRIPPWYVQTESLSSSPSGAWLFDLAKDPGQRTNLIEEFPEIAARLRSDLPRRR